MKLFNIRTDYREENDLASTMPDKVSEMEVIRRNYVEEADGGTVEQAKPYKTMDKFSSQSKEGFRKALARLKGRRRPTSKPRRRRCSRI